MEMLKCSLCDYVCTFTPTRTNTYEIMDDTSLFTVDSSSGLIQTAEPMGRFADGYFLLYVKASNGPQDKREGDTVPIRVKNVIVFHLIMSIFTLCDIRNLMSNIYFCRHFKQ